MTWSPGKITFWLAVLLYQWLDGHAPPYIADDRSVSDVGSSSGSNQLRLCCRLLPFMIGDCALGRTSSIYGLKSIYTFTIKDIVTIKTISIPLEQNFSLSACTHPSWSCCLNSVASKRSWQLLLHDFVGQAAKPNTRCFPILNNCEAYIYIGSWLRALKSVLDFILLVYKTVIYCIL